MIFYTVATCLLIFEVSEGGVLLNISTDVVRNAENTRSIAKELTNHPFQGLSDGRAEILLEPSWNNDDLREPIVHPVFRQGQGKKPVKTAMAQLLISIAEVLSQVAAVPIAVAISLVNKVSDVTNNTLHVSGEFTKLPATITNSIIQELSNITFPN